MTTFKKENLNELVGGDFSSGGGDRNPVGDVEIETGPVAKSFNDKSDYEKGTPTTTDRVFGRYVQDIPWFALYNFAGSRNGYTVNEEKVDEKLVKPDNKKSGLLDKKSKDKVEKIIDSVMDLEFDEIKRLTDLLKKRINA